MFEDAKTGGVWCGIRKYAKFGGKQILPFFGQRKIFSFEVDSLLARKTKGCLFNKKMRD